MPSTPAERSTNARRAALHRSATTDGSAISQPARDAWLASFAPSDPELTEAERARRAKAALRARMTELSQIAARKRRRAAEDVADADRLEQLAGDLGAAV